MSERVFRRGGPGRANTSIARGKAAAFRLYDDAVVERLPLFSSALIASFVTAADFIASPPPNAIFGNRRDRAPRQEKADEAILCAVAAPSGPAGFASGRNSLGQPRSDYRDIAWPWE